MSRWRRAGPARISDTWSAMANASVWSWVTSERGRARGPQGPGDLIAQRGPQLGVQRREGLVQQDERGPRRQGPSQRHPLLLTAGQLVGPAGAETGQPGQFEQLLDPSPPCGPPTTLQPERHVGGDIEVGEQRAVLGDQPDPPPLRREHPLAGRRPPRRRSGSRRRRVGRSRPASAATSSCRTPTGRSQRGDTPERTVRSTASSTVTAGGPANTLVTPRTSTVVTGAPATCVGRGRRTRAATTRPWEDWPSTRWRQRRARHRRTDPASVWPHSRVASVSVPIGRSNRVAGNSFITVRHTSAAATPTPGAARRNVTVVHTVQGRRPRVRAASSIDGDTWVIGVADGPEGQGQEQHDVGEDQHRGALVQRRRQPDAEEDHGQARRRCPAGCDRRRPTVFGRCDRRPGKRATSSANGAATITVATAARTPRTQVVTAASATRLQSMSARPRCSQSTSVARGTANVTAVKAVAAATAGHRHRPEPDRHDIAMQPGRGPRLVALDPAHQRDHEQ